MKPKLIAVLVQSVCWHIGAEWREQQGLIYAGG